MNSPVDVLLIKEKQCIVFLKIRMKLQCYCKISLQKCAHLVRGKSGFYVTTIW
jgi:hypothetical protein